MANTSQPANLKMRFVNLYVEVIRSNLAFFFAVRCNVWGYKSRASLDASFQFIYQINLAEVITKFGEVILGVPN